MMLGPVQVLVVGVPDADQADVVVASLRGLGEDAPVCLLDAFVVGVDADGAVTLDEGDEPPRTAALFLQPEEASATAVLGPEVWDLGQVVPPGELAVVALLEHRWATPLRDALLAAGGSVAHETWLDHDDRDTLAALLGR